MCVKYPGGNIKFTSAVEIDSELIKVDKFLQIWHPLPPKEQGATSQRAPQAFLKSSGYDETVFKGLVTIH